MKVGHWFTLVYFRVIINKIDVILRLVDVGNLDFAISLEEAIHIKIKRKTWNKKLFNLRSSSVFGTL